MSNSVKQLRQILRDEALAAQTDQALVNDGKAAAARAVSTSGGLTGGGDLTADRAISLAQVPVWSAGMTVTAGQLVLSPVGAYTATVRTLVQALTSFTAGGSFVTGNWTQLADVAPAGTSFDTTTLLRPWLGDGSDGAVAFDGSTANAGFSSLSGSTYTLTRDVYATSITVSSGVTVLPTGFRIYATGTVTNAGTIKNNGGAASGTATAGAATVAGTLGASSAGTAGGTGLGTASTATTNALGGRGGRGGNGTSGTAATAGACTAPTTNNGGQTQFARLPCAATGRTDPGTAMNGGSGGSAGSGDSTNSGGAGGGGGGPVLIAARSIVNTSGTISANGGVGGNSSAGNTGGGGGGGGGGVILLCTTFTGNAATATGGNGGTATGTGTAGATGSAGVVYLVQT